MRCYNHADAPATTVCLGCLRALCLGCAGTHEHYCERGYQPSVGAAAIERPCHHHADEPSRGICADCGQPICVRCGGLVDGRLTCPDCRQREDEAAGLAYQGPRPGMDWSQVLRLGGLVTTALVIAALALLVAGVVGQPSGLSAQAGSNGSGSPADLVQRHYAYLAAGKAEAAWQQLSPSFQQLTDYQTWANSYAGSQIEPSDLEVASESPASATVVGNATLTSVGGTSVVRGQWTALLVEGKWRLDSISFTSSVERQR